MLNLQYSTIKQTVYAQQLNLDWSCNLSIRLSPQVSLATSIENPKELYYSIWLEERKGESGETKININKVITIRLWNYLVSSIDCCPAV